MYFDIRTDLSLKSFLTSINRLTASLALITCSCLSTLVYAEELGDAFDIYKKSYLNKSSGVYVKDSLTFVIADIAITNKKIRSLHYEGKALLLTHKLLKSHIIQGLEPSSGTTRSSPGKLTEDLNHFISSGAFANFRLNSMNSRVLINRGTRDTYRRVAVFYSDDIAAERNQLKEILQDREKLINSVFDDAIQNQRYDDLVVYFLELGLFREALIYRKKTLDTQYYLVNYPAFRFNPYEDRKALRDILVSNGEQKINPHLLESLPGNVEIIDHIKKSLDNQDYLGRIVLDLTTLPSLPDTMYRERIALIKQNIKTLSEQYPGLKEDLALFAIPKNNAFPDSNPLPAVLMVSLANFGFLDIDSSYSNQENQYFLKAKELFNQGIAVDKIFGLLTQSLHTSPRHVESWIYLGALLVHKDQVDKAMVMYQQAYLLDNANLETTAHLADIYYLRNQMKTAKAYQTYLKIRNKNSQINFVKKVIGKIG